MKRLILLVIFCLPLTMESSEAEGRVCGTLHLARHRDDFPLPRGKVVAELQEEEIGVGTQLEFLVAGDSQLLPATCQYAGEHCYIFVEDSQWDTNGGAIFQTDVDGLGELFDRSTPADEERGIYELGVESFGPPPDVDGEERIFILVLETSASELIGFFDPRVANWPNPALRRDTIYLDSRALRSRRYLARGTLAHEFQHLIHWGQDADEETWVDEGLSGYAEELTGFPETDETMVDAFLAQPDLDLTFWPAGYKEAIPHYGMTFLFASFLAERYGVETIRQLVEEPRNGTFGVDEAFKKSGWVQSFKGAWAQWIVANYAADDDLYGYGALKGRRTRTFAAPPLPFAGIGGSVNRTWGATHVIFRAPDGDPVNIAVEFAGEEAGRYSVWGYIMRGTTGEVVELALDAANAGSIQAVEVDSMVVVVGRTSLAGPGFELAARTFASTAVNGAAAGLPGALHLGEIYPNPFNGQAILPFDLSEAAELELSLYNSLGQRIRVLRRGMHPAGHYQVLWDGLDAVGKKVASGTYLAALRVGTKRLTRRLSMVK